MLAQMESTQVRHSLLAQAMQDSMPSLRRMAHGRLFKSGNLTLLDTTSLIQETFLKLAQSRGLAVADQQQFLGYCARTMRSLIVDYVRARGSEKRGLDAVHTELDTGFDHVQDQHNEAQILQLHDALCELSDLDPRMASIVEMRYFGGFLETEIAAALSIDERTVRREWQKARLFLFDALQ